MELQEREEHKEQKHIGKLIKKLKGERCLLNLDLKMFRSLVKAALDFQTNFGTYLHSNI